MGIADVADAKDMPIYEEGMQPPDGSGAWRFGNLRFDWSEYGEWYDFSLVLPTLTLLDATLRRSSHNVAMRDIVLKHIISVRAEYDEIPDSEFEPVRLEPAFDQAFGTWKVSRVFWFLLPHADIFCRESIRENAQEGSGEACRLTRTRRRQSKMGRPTRTVRVRRRGHSNSLGVIRRRCRTASVRLCLAHCISWTILAV